MKVPAHKRMRTHIVEYIRDAFRIHVPVCVIQFVHHATNCLSPLSQPMLIYAHVCDARLQMILHAS